MELLRLLRSSLPPWAFDIVKLTNGLVLLAVLFIPLERLFALRPQKIFRKGFFSDLVYYFLSSLLPNSIVAVPLAGLALVLQRLGSESFQLQVADLPLWLRFIAAMVVAEIGFYWGHRWMHQSDLLWRFHAVHHGPTEMDWLVNTHAHPVDLVFTRLCGYVPLYILGLAQPAGSHVDWLPLTVALVGSVWGYFIHANIRLRFGWLEHVVATPGFHHWHHNNAGPHHRHNNYAPTMPWVDRIFGTFALDSIHWPDMYGVGDGDEPELSPELIRPFLPDR